MNQSISGLSISDFFSLHYIHLRLEKSEEMEDLFNVTLESNKTINDNKVAFILLWYASFILSKSLTSPVPRAIHFGKCIL